MKRKGVWLYGTAGDRALCARIAQSRRTPRIDCPWSRTTGDWLGYYLQCATRVFVPAGCFLSFQVWDQVSLFTLWESARTHSAEEGPSCHFLEKLHSFQRECVVKAKHAVLVMYFFFFFLLFFF